jgi:hypothetical protein
MNIADLEATLPWGLHDARLESIEVDWLNARATLTVRVRVTAGQDIDRRGRITVGGLVFCSIDAPEIDPSRHYEPVPPTGSGSVPVKELRTMRPRAVCPWCRTGASSIGFSSRTGTASSTSAVATRTSLG